MSKKRTDFRKMSYSDFIDYLNKNAIPYTENEKNDLMEVVPNHFRLKSRSFPISKEDINFEEIVSVISKRIEAMATKGVYHPKRIRPKWKHLQTTQEKLNYFEKMISNPESSIGFIKLVGVNLCHKTLEAIIVENPSYAHLFNTEKLFDVCVSKFKKYENGRAYLLTKGITVEDVNTT